MPGVKRLRVAGPYLAALAAGGGLLVVTLGFPPPRPGTLGPAFWPRAAILLMMVVSLVEIVRIATRATQPAAAPVETDEDDDGPRHPWRLLAGLALVAGYAASITTLGYLLASTLFLIVFMYIGGYRNHLVLWLSAALGMLVIAVIFLKVAYVSLPRGAPPFDGWTQSILRLFGIG
jgi:hypothetical protein